jgi:hypothetical protein
MSKKLNFREATYAFLVNVADLDDKITSQERYAMDHFHDKAFGLLALTDKTKKKIGSELKHTMKPDEYDKLIIDSLKEEKKEKQMKAYRIVNQFINVNYKAKDAPLKKARAIREGLDFNEEDFEKYNTWQNNH